MIPSAVRSDRSLLRASARKATLRVFPVFVTAAIRRRESQAQPASDSSRIFSASSTSPALTMSGGEIRMTLP